MDRPLATTMAAPGWQRQPLPAAMSDEEFARWVDLLERRTGVVVPPARKPFLVTGLRARMRETGHLSFDSYYRDLVDGVRGRLEWVTLVDRLTVHQTQFFRHPPSLAMVEHEWLPKRLAASDWDGSLHLWSLGCSTGEEAYTLAMVLDGAIARQKARYYLGITATDVSRPALEVGRAGLYARQRSDEIPAPYWNKYCAEVDGDSFRIREVLRRRVAFVPFNLLDIATPPLRAVDLIYCQNVLIYFARDRRRYLLGALASLLRPGGLLVLGPGEVLNWHHPALSRFGGKQVLAYLRTG